MNQFAEWLSGTFPSVFIQNNNAWLVPAIQSIHIVGIGLVLGSVFMIYLRLMGWAGMDRTLRQTTDRYSPWLTAALYLLLATGVLLVIAEPVRELVTFSFWLKMFLVSIVAAIAILLRRAVKKREDTWANFRTKLMATMTFLIWTCIIVLGRLIAYDHVWGSWSPATKA